MITVKLDPALCYLGFTLSAFQTKSTAGMDDILLTMFKNIHPSLQDIQDYLLFYYYSAILLGRNQNWKQMHFNLEQVISGRFIYPITRKKSDKCPIN